MPQKKKAVREAEEPLRKDLETLFSHKYRMILKGVNVNNIVDDILGIINEQITPTEPPEPSPPPKPKEVKLDEYGCRVGEEEWNADLNQCVKIEKQTPTKEQVTVPYQPAPEIPAQPVVPVGPVTIEQKVAALNDKIAEIEKLLANLYGLTGHSLEEVKTALTWKMNK